MLGLLFVWRAVHGAGGLGSSFPAASHTASIGGDSEAGSGPDEQGTSFGATPGPTSSPNTGRRRLSIGVSVEFSHWASPVTKDFKMITVPGVCDDRYGDCSIGKSCRCPRRR